MTWGVSRESATLNHVLLSRVALGSFGIADTPRLLTLLTPIVYKLRDIAHTSQPNPLLCSFKGRLEMRLVFVTRGFASVPGQSGNQEKDPPLKRPRGLHFTPTTCLYQIFTICSVALFLAALTLHSRRTYDVGTSEEAGNAGIHYGTFQAPSARVRPRFRYWLPDASVNASQVADDIREAGRVGSGGVELLGYYLYGNVQIFPGNYDLLQSDWTVNYFGSPAWSERLFCSLLNALLTPRER
jgi:hypothetical protein